MRKHSLKTMSDLENYLIATCNFKTRIKRYFGSFGVIHIKVEADTDEHGCTKLNSELYDRLVLGAIVSVDKMDEWTQISQHEHCAVLDYT